MDVRPKFSIIIPVYNVEKFIRAAVLSALEQKNAPPVEVILVDDGSTDGCPAICDSFAESDTRVRVIHKANGGVTSARKAGTEIASGEYTVCLDGDDWLREDTLAKIASVIDESGSPDVISIGMIETDGKTEHRIWNNTEAGAYSREKIEKEIFPMLIQSESAGFFPPSVCGKAIKTELFKSRQLNQADPCGEQVTGEDRVCSIACVYSAGSLYVIDEGLYFYRNHPDSATHSKRVLSWNSPMFTNGMIERSVDVSKFGFGEQLSRKIVHDLYSVVLSQFYRREPFFRIRADIVRHIGEPYYADAIKKARFSGSLKAALMMASFRLRIFFPMWIYSHRR